jgi:hypothetical protein
MWANFGATVNNAYFFVADKILDLQTFFIAQAWSIGRYVLFIAISSVALNYALTGAGLKENLIKIGKAFFFFFLVMNLYPRIIGSITAWTFSMAEGSVYPSVRDHFYKTTSKLLDYVDYDSNNGRTYINKTISEITSTTDRNLIFYDRGNLSTTREHRVMTYQTVTPATVLQVLFLTAGECIDFAQDDRGGVFNVGQQISNAIKGFSCGFVIIFTGVFALIEYLICFLEFMLVSSVGIILFPLSLWEGSKFMAEKFIGAIVGFFIKLLFCNLAIFLLVYGFVSLQDIISQTGFTGSIDQLIFVVFVCTLFFYICKSAPAVAQSLLTGTPSLSAAGAVSAVGGAVAAAAGTVGFAKSAAGKVGGTVIGGGAKGLLGGLGSLAEANAAKSSAMDAVKEAGGSVKQQRQAGNSAFRSSLASDVGDSLSAAGLGLTRRLLGDKQGGGQNGSGGTNPHSWRQDLLNTPGKEGNQTLTEHFDKRNDEGAGRGKKSADKYISKNNITAGK